jgi:hypothetical protein
MNPAGHDLQDACAASFWYVPASHAAGIVFPPEQYVPAGHTNGSAEPIKQ